MGTDELDEADEWGAAQRQAIEQELGADPGGDPVVRLLARQTAVLTAALGRGQRPGDQGLDVLLGGGDGGGSQGPIGGARGAAALEVLRNRLETRPDLFVTAVRKNMARALGTALDQPTDCEEYTRRHGTFGRHRDLGYVQMLVANVWNLLETDRVHAAHAAVSLLLVALEQTCLDDRWDLGYLLTHRPDPPRETLIRQPDRSGLRPFSRLAEPQWVAAGIAYCKDVDAMAERRRKRDGGDPNPKPGKYGKGKDAAES